FLQLLGIAAGLLDELGHDLTRDRVSFLGVRGIAHDGWDVLIDFRRIGILGNRFLAELGIREKFLRVGQALPGSGVEFLGVGGNGKSQQEKKRHVSYCTGDQASLPAANWAPSASAFSTPPRSVPPAWAMSGFPPPRPEMAGAIALMSSPAL